MDSDDSRLRQGSRGELPASCSETTGNPVGSTQRGGSGYSREQLAEANSPELRSGSRWGQATSSTSLGVNDSNTARVRARVEGVDIETPPEERMHSHTRTDDSKHGSNHTENDTGNVDINLFQFGSKEYISPWSIGPTARDITTLVMDVTLGLSMLLRGVWDALQVIPQTAMLKSVWKVVRRLIEAALSPKQLFRDLRYEASYHLIDWLPQILGFSILIVILPAAARALVEAATYLVTWDIGFANERSMLLFLLLRIVLVRPFDRCFLWGLRYMNPSFAFELASLPAPPTHILVRASLMRILSVRTALALLWFVAETLADAPQASFVTSAFSFQCESSSISACKSLESQCVPLFDTFFQPYCWKAYPSFQRSLFLATAGYLGDPYSGVPSDLDPTQITADIEHPSIIGRIIGTIIYIMQHFIVGAALARELFDPVFSRVSYYLGKRFTSKLAKDSLRTALDSDGNPRRRTSVMQRVRWALKRLQQSLYDVLYLGPMTFPTYATAFNLSDALAQVDRLARPVRDTEALQGFERYFLVKPWDIDSPQDWDLSEYQSSYVEIATLAPESSDSIRLPSHTSGGANRPLSALTRLSMQASDTSMMASEESRMVYSGTNLGITAPAPISTRNPASIQVRPRTPRFFSFQTQPSTPETSDRKLEGSHNSSFLFVASSVDPEFAPVSPRTPRGMSARGSRGSIVRTLTDSHSSDSRHSVPSNNNSPGYRDPVVSTTEHAHCILSHYYDDAFDRVSFSSEGSARTGLNASEDGFASSQNSLSGSWASTHATSVPTGNQPKHCARNRGHRADVFEIEEVAVQDDVTSQAEQKTITSRPPLGIEDLVADTPRVGDVEFRFDRLDPRSIDQVALASSLAAAAAALPDDVSDRSAATASSPRSPTMALLRARASQVAMQSSYVTSLLNPPQSADAANETHPRRSNQIPNSLRHRQEEGASKEDAGIHENSPGNLSPSASSSDNMPAHEPISEVVVQLLKHPSSVVAHWRRDSALIHERIPDPPSSGGSSEPSYILRFAFVSSSYAVRAYLAGIGFVFLFLVTSLPYCAGGLLAFHLAAAAGMILAVDMARPSMLARATALRTVQMRTASASDAETIEHTSLDDVAKYLTAAVFTASLPTFHVPSGTTPSIWASLKSNVTFFISLCRSLTDPDFFFGWEVARPLLCSSAWLRQAVRDVVHSPVASGVPRASAYQSTSFASNHMTL